MSTKVVTAESLLLARLRERDGTIRPVFVSTMAMDVGWHAFHGWCGTQYGMPSAICEKPDGTVEIYDMSAGFRLRFEL